MAIGQLTARDRDFDSRRAIASAATTNVSGGVDWLFVVTRTPTGKKRRKI